MTIDKRKNYLQKQNVFGEEKITTIITKTTKPKQNDFHQRAILIAKLIVCLY